MTCGKSVPLAAAEETPGVYVILDGSGSMWVQLPDGTHKITAAKEVVKGFTAGDYAGRELAFLAELDERLPRVPTSRSSSLSLR